MGTFLWLMLLFPGVCGLSSSVPRQFHVVQQQNNWAEAQQYCRDEFTDLATIDDMAEMEKLQGIIQKQGVTEAWIGLTYGSSPKWQWSLADRDFYGENEAEFRNWGPGQPGGDIVGDCVLIGIGGQWFDVSCMYQRFFICYDGRNSTHPYVLIEEWKTWKDAQRYCREHYADLASVRNQTENDLIEAVRTPGGGGAWIGLFRDAWEWSDGSNSSFRHWARRQPNNNNNEHCVQMRSSGLWHDHRCNSNRKLICYEALPTVEVVSPQSPFYPGDTVTMRCDIAKYADNRQYVWLKDNSPVSGGTSQTITITLPEDAGQYQCGGQRDPTVAPYISKPVNITCNDLPAATVEVVSPPGPNYSGDVVTLKCNVTQFEGWHQYVWLKDNSPVPGETSQTITITLPQEAGQYQCYRQRENGSKTSSPSNVHIISNDLPAATVEVVSPPGPHYSGDVVTLKCSVTQFEDWHQYVWLKDDSTVPGETSQTITITLPEKAGQYQCYGQREDGSKTSSLSDSVHIISNDLPAATVEVVSPPGPHYSGDVVTLKCSVTQFEGWHQYVWLKDNSPVPGETRQTISITLPQEAGQYQCYRHREDGSKTSSPSTAVDISSDDNLVLVPENKTWLEALQYCRQHHVDLVSVSSGEIQRWVEGWARGASSPHVWMGLRYECTFGFWFWVNGYSVCYSNWAPNTESEHCCETRGAAVARDGGKWLSLDENEKLNFICTTKE